MKTNKLAWIGIVAALLLGAAWYAFEVSRETAEQADFLRALRGTLSQDATNLENIPAFQSIDISGGGWFTINGYDSNPSKDIYYTIGQVHFAGFASSTDLTRGQVDALTNMFKTYPFIARIENNINIGGECADGRNSLHNCTALEFYLPIGLYRLWFTDAASWYSTGFLYVPFPLSASNQSYLSRYFSSVKEIAPNWYSFSGQHL